MGFLLVRATAIKVFVTPDTQFVYITTLPQETSFRIQDTNSNKNASRSPFSIAFVRRNASHQAVYAVGDVDSDDDYDDDGADDDADDGCGW